MRVENTLICEIKVSGFKIWTDLETILAGPSVIAVLANAHLAYLLGL